MIAVLDTGIQDTLNLILVQTSGLEPIPQGISTRAYVKQCKDWGRERELLKLLHIPILASVVTAKALLLADLMRVSLLKASP